MRKLDRLVAAGCRVDGILFAATGDIVFARTNGGGDWTDEQKAAVLAALGKSPVELTPQQQEARRASAVQGWLDETARTHGYDSFAAAASYASSGVDLWKRQAQAFIAWRDLVWQAVFAQPGADLAQLPQPNIPTI